MDNRLVKENDESSSNCGGDGGTGNAVVVQRVPHPVDLPLYFLKTSMKNQPVLIIFDIRRRHPEETDSIKI